MVLRLERYLVRKYGKKFRRKRLPAVVAFFLFVTSLPSPALLAQTASEARVKAAYLFNFVKLAEWPAGALPPSPSPLNFCVVGGDDDFLDVLRSTVAGKTVAGHEISVKAGGAIRDITSCQLVFVRSTEKSRTAAVVGGMAGARALLVGEDDSFLANGGMINLYLSDGKVRFHANPGALDHAHIVFDPSFLSLASRDTDSNRGSEPGSRAVASRIEAEMPDVARRMSLSGTVQLQAVVRANGTVKNVRVLGGHPLLADAAMQAVRQWRYRPAASETIEVVKISFGP